MYYNFDFWSEILITNYNKDKNKCECVQISKLFVFVFWL